MSCGALRNACDEIETVKAQLRQKREDLEEMAEEKEIAETNAAYCEGLMFEAQEELEEFKAAHLPRIEVGEEMNFKQGELVRIWSRWWSCVVHKSCFG